MDYILPKELHGSRLDKALAELVDKSTRSQMQIAIKDCQIQVNKVIISDSSYKVKENDVIDCIFKEPPPTTMQVANIKLDIVYEDEDLIVINKVAGMTVHPGAGNHQDTLANALLYHAKHLSDIGGMERPGIVHRLDKDTSGLIIVAKNNFAHVNLAKQIETRQLVRKYKALVWGRPNPSEGIVTSNIGRSNSDRKKMTTLKEGGKEAITYYKTEEIFLGGLISLVECKLETGRTHQIRVQMSHMKHSVVGDQTYGHNNRKINNSFAGIQEKLLSFKRQALHSWYMSFNHPQTDEFMEFNIPMAVDIEEIMTMLREFKK